MLFVTITVFIFLEEHRFSEFMLSWVVGIVPLGISAQRVFESVISFPRFFPKFYSEKNLVLSCTLNFTLIMG